MPDDREQRECPLCGGSMHLKETETVSQIPGNPLRSFDISFVNPHRGEYYLAERSNAAVVVINTKDLDAPVRMLGGFVGIKNNPNGFPLDPERLVAGRRSGQSLSEMIWER